jgi:hypothetical protein
MARPGHGLGRKLAVQRTIWIYGSDGYWEKEKKDPVPEGQADTTNRVMNPPRRPVKNSRFEVGDSYDDTDPNPVLFHGRNAQTRGMPGKLVGYDPISPEEDESFRKGLAVAKLKLTKSVAAVRAGETAARSGPIDGHLRGTIEVAFNVPGSTPRPELLGVLEILVVGLEKLLKGLSDEVLLISSARMRMYGVTDKPADCSGWVPRYMTELGGRATPATGAQDLKEMSGEIHMKTGSLHSPSFVGDTIIHEAAHKFLGAWDYSYVGVQGSVGRGLDQKARDAMNANAALTATGAREQAKAESSNRAYAEVVQKIVSNGIEPVFPAGMTRGLAAKPTDGQEVQAARQVWNVVKTWGLPQSIPPTPTQLDNAITQLLNMAGLPGEAKSELGKLRANKEGYLAEHGNDLGVKGHDVLFALPTGFLLKNADSWTELALTAAP